TTGFGQAMTNRYSDVTPNRAGSYIWEDEKLHNFDVCYSPWVWPGGGLYSTVTDLAKFDAALSAGRLLDKKSLWQMWAPTRLNNGETAGYGLNWVLNWPYVPGHKSAGHVGGNALATYARFVNDKTSIIILANLDNGDAGIAEGLARLYLSPSNPIADDEP